MSYFDQPTQQFPSLAPPNGGGAPPLGPQRPPYPALPYAAAQYGPVPAVPPRRGAGFWVCVTAAIAAGVVLALLAGFFIGRGSRLSNADVQSKITQQAQADQITEQQALSAQKGADQTAEDKAVVQAQKNGEAAGLRQGQTEGQQQGFQQGQQAGYQQGQTAGQAQGFQQGQQQGFNQGQSSGYGQGFNSGLCASQSLVC
jgi:hypothetical protein